MIQQILRLLVVCMLGVVLAGTVGVSATTRAQPTGDTFAVVTALASTGGGTPIYVAGSGGIYRSGAPFGTFTHQNTIGGITAIAVNPLQANDLVWTDNTGAIYRSTDGGKTSIKTAPKGTASCLARSTGSAGTIFAAGCYTSADLYRSSDDGATWARIYTVPDSSPGVSTINAIVVDPANDRRVLIAAGLYHGGEIAQSLDGGGTWQPLSSPTATSLEAPDAIGIDPANPASIWVGWSLMGSGQIAHSDDNGQTWQLVSPSPTNQVLTAVDFDPSHKRVYLAVAGEMTNKPEQVYLTGDGTHFSQLDPTADFGRQVVVLSNAGILLAGDQATPLLIEKLRQDGSATGQIPSHVTGVQVIPAVVRVFVGDLNGNIYALDGETGRYLRTFHISHSVMGTPILATGLLYAGSTDGNIYALNPGDGTLIWRAHLGGRVLTPVPAGGTIYAASDNGKLFALNAQTGGERWQLSAGSGLTAPSIAATLVYIRTRANGIGAFSTYTGALRWHYTGGSDLFLLAVHAEDGIVFGEGAQGQVIALNATNGHLLWRFHAAIANSLPVQAAVGGSANGSVYLEAGGTSLYALDERTGTMHWQFTARDKMASPPVVTGGVVYASAWDEYLYALDARTGALRWRFKTDSAIQASPAVRNHTVFLTSSDHLLYALDAATGHPRWHFSVDAPNAIPAIQTPADAAPANNAGARYFNQTGHNLGGAFLAFWQRYGGLSVFGYPLTEPFGENGTTVQYTERFALQLRSGRIQMLPLGRTLTAGRSFPTTTPVPSTPGMQYFVATHQVLSGSFLTFWRTHYGALLLGAPIGDLHMEGNGDGTGRRYPTQWFENGRLEYHPELAGTRYAVEIGLAGAQALRARGWIA